MTNPKTEFSAINNDIKPYSFKADSMNLHPRNTQKKFFYVQKNNGEEHIVRGIRQHTV